MRYFAKNLRPLLALHISSIMLICLASGCGHTGTNQSAPAEAAATGEVIEPSASAAGKTNPPAKTETARSSFGEETVRTSAEDAATGAGSLPADPEYVDREIWMSNFEQAMAKAAAERKDILMDFTGSDWCGWCIRLNQEVFRHREFVEYAEQHFVLLELDYPRDTSGLSEETQTQNSELQDRFSIQGYPTILLADGRGRPYAQTGYQAGGPESYVAHLEGLQQIRVARDEAFAAAEGLKGIERGKKLNDALLAISPNLVFPSYEDQVAQIVQLDENNEAGLREEYQERLYTSQFRRSVKELEQFFQSTGDVDNALAQLDEIEAKFADYSAAHLTLNLIRLQLLQIAGHADDVAMLADSLLADKSLEAEERLLIYSAKLGGFANSSRWDEAVELVDSVLKEFSHDSRLSAQLLITKAKFLVELRRTDEARAALSEARQQADSRLLQAIDQVEKQLFSSDADATSEDTE